MSSVRDIIGRAHRLLGLAPSGDAMPEANYQDGLVALNAMIESWQTERLIVFAYVETAFTEVVGDSSYTVGPSGNFNLTPRPSKIENIFIRASGIDYPVQLVDQERWFAITDKAVTSDIATLAYYEPTLPTGNMNIWPVPSKANSLHIVTWSPVSSFSALSTTVTLPQGYERAITSNLALELAPEYQLAPSADVQRVAVESLSMIKRANQRPMIAYTELGIMMSNPRSDIYSGGPAT